MTDPITDLFNRIKNAQAVFRPTVDVPFSNLKYEIVKILKKQGFIEKAEKKGRKTKKIIEIILKYQTPGPKKDSLLPVQDKTPAIAGFRKVSKPGQRIYLPAKKIRRVRGGYGVAIISTSKGLRTDKEARKQKLGGEVICEIW